jgi:hypothetical protein
VVPVFERPMPNIFDWLEFISPFPSMLSFYLSCLTAGLIYYSKVCICWIRARAMYTLHFPVFGMMAVNQVLYLQGIRLLLTSNDGNWCLVYGAQIAQGIGTGH